MVTLGPLRVFVDANVWYDRCRRDWLGMLYVIAETPPFVICWSEDVMAELLHALRKQHPNWDGGQITRIRDKLCGTFEVGRVESYSVDASYKGADLHDAHVHAAAIACQADVLLTLNTKDFVWDENDSPYDLLTPDDFLVLVHESAPALVAEVTKKMRDYWMGKRGEANLPDRLRRADCPMFAKVVRQHLQVIPL